MITIQRHPHYRFVARTADSCTLLAGIGPSVMSPWPRTVWAVSGRSDLRHVAENLRLLESQYYWRLRRVVHYEWSDVPQAEAEIQGDFTDRNDEEQGTAPCRMILHWLDRIDVVNEGTITIYHDWLRQMFKIHLEDLERRGNESDPAKIVALRAALALAPSGRR